MRSRAGLLLALWLTAVCAAAAAAPGILITHAETYSNQDFILLDADFSVQLSGEAQRALENGVPLVFDISTDLRAKRRWLWDPIIVQTKQQSKLEYHSLSERYIVSNLTLQTRASYPQLNDALAALGRVRDFAVCSTAELVAAAAVKARLRVALNIEALPAPMRVVAYLTPEWHLRSAPYKWQVNTP